jgi:hypothetical protein
LYAEESESRLSRTRPPPATQGLRAAIIVLNRADRLLKIKNNFLSVILLICRIFFDDGNNWDLLETLDLNR